MEELMARIEQRKRSNPAPVGRRFYTETQRRLAYNLDVTDRSADSSVSSENNTTQETTCTPTRLTRMEQILARRDLTRRTGLAMGGDYNQFTDKPPKFNPQISIESSEESDEEEQSCERERSPPTKKTFQSRYSPSPPPSPSPSRDDDDQEATDDNIFDVAPDTPQLFPPPARHRLGRRNLDVRDDTDSSIVEEDDGERVEMVLKPPPLVLPKSSEDGIRRFKKTKVDERERSPPTKKTFQSRYSPSPSPSRDDDQVATDDSIFDVAPDTHQLFPPPGRHCLGRRNLDVRDDTDSSIVEEDDGERVEMVLKPSPLVLPKLSEDGIRRSKRTKVGEKERSPPTKKTFQSRYSPSPSPSRDDDQVATDDSIFDVAPDTHQLFPPPGRHCLGRRNLDVRDDTDSSIVEEDDGERVEMVLKPPPLVLPKSSEDGIRRSKRTKVGPLRRWLGEEPVYDNSPGGSRTMTGISRVVVNDPLLLKTKTSDIVKANHRDRRRR